MAKLFGSDVIGQTQEVWGLDGEGELRGCYRPSGHPGVSVQSRFLYTRTPSSNQIMISITTNLT